MFLRKMVNLMMKKIITLALASIICTEVVYPMQTPAAPAQQEIDRSFTQAVKENPEKAGYILAALCCACAGLAYNLSMQIPEQKSICNMCATATACCAIGGFLVAGNCKNKKVKKD